ncbi:MAG TPA: 3-dehydroquinate synthase [Clostridiales bacterium]|nr:3-dehydroquinate synthase [Clostridiales bacterium]HQP70094.1 3-dehydroquinate synthase [Clostridiales bacterium]
MNSDNRIIFADAHGTLKQELKGKSFVFITDENVFEVYKNKLYKNCVTLILKSGERTKSIRTIECIYEHLLDIEADRKTVIVGVGGGVVCDIAGYVSATFKRGTGLVLVPTTLLAQADAAIGGKNGVNFKRFKNIIGTFRQPDKIIIDTALLKTLDRRNFNNGAAEVIKTASVGDKKLFKLLSKKPLSELTKAEMNEAVKTSAKIKEGIVLQDPTDKGIRKILNFGHTLGHAIELIGKKMMHGEAVSIGMVAACRISEKLSGLDKKVTEKFKKVLEMNSLPFEIPAKISTEQIIGSIIQDKKKESDNIDFIMLEEIGHPVIKRIEIKKLRKLIDDIR